MRETSSEDSTFDFGLKSSCVSDANERARGANGEDEGNARVDDVAAAAVTSDDARRLKTRGAGFVAPAAAVALTAFIIMRDAHRRVIVVHAMVCAAWAKVTRASRGGRRKARASLKSPSYELFKAYGTLR